MWRTSLLPLISAHELTPPSPQLPEEAKVLALQQILSLTAIARGLTPSDDFDFDSEGEEEQHSKGETWQARMDPRLLDVRQRMLNAVASMVELWSSDSEVVDVRMAIVP